MKVKLTGIFFLTVFLHISVLAQGVQDWVHFQNINTEPDTIHALTFGNGLLALNINNDIIDIYELTDDQFTYSKSYEIKWVWNEFGTMRFFGDYLYVSIDGHKYYRIDYHKDKVRKTNTYKAGFYIMSRYDNEYRDDEWIFEIEPPGKLEVYHNYARKVKEEYLQRKNEKLPQQNPGDSK